MRAIIVTGAESTGSRLMAEIVEVGGFKRDDAMECSAESIVIHRSAPHGPAMPDLAGMVNQLRGRGYNVQAIVTVRNPFAVAESQVAKGHSVDLGQAYHKQQVAFSFIGQQLEHCRCDFLVIPYDALVARPGPVMSQILEYFSLTLGDLVLPEILDENEKYYAA